MRAFHLTGLLATLLLAGCGPGPSPYFDTVTVLAAGEVTNGLPSFKLRSVMLRGNYGLLWAGTNPLAVAGGQFYSGSQDGAAPPIGREESITAGWITYFEADRSYDVAEMDQRLFRQTMAWKRPAPGRMEAVLITGLFSHVRSREWGEETNVQGRLMGLYVPTYLRGLQPNEYRWWFLDDSRHGVLRIEDFTVKAARIEMDECNDLQVRLPPIPPPG